MQSLRNDGGFSLIEMVIASTIVVLVTVMLSQTLADIAKFDSQIKDMSLTPLFRDDVKQMLRRKATSGAPDESLCREKMVEALTPADFRDLFHHQDRDYNMGRYNPVPEKRYDELELERAYLTNVRLLSEAKAFQVPEPGVLALSLAPPDSQVRLIQAEWMFRLKVKNAQEITKPLRIKLAIQRMGETYTLTNCGYGQLATTISHMEACKTLGPDFEFVYDNFNGPGTGQCYAPIYDPCFASATPVARAECELTNAAYSGNKEFKVTHLAPLKVAFCQMVLQGKSYTFPFCTGVK